MIGQPSTKDFIQIVDGNHLFDYPITRDNIMNAEDMSVKDVGIPKGKLTCKC
jgi:hypothetical protein